MNEPYQPSSVPSSTASDCPSVGLWGTVLFIIGLIVGAGLIWYLAPGAVKTGLNESPKPSVSGSPEPTPYSQADLERMFNLANKIDGTRLFFSEDLGVGFTYLPSEGYDVAEPFVTEEDGIVVINGSNELGLPPASYGQTIEVFEKDPEDSLTQAIEKRFLRRHDPDECEVHEGTGRGPEGYRTASIVYTGPENPDNPWFTTCPQYYSASNGISFFLMNPDEPDRFIYVSIGQYSPATDGTPRSEGGLLDWYTSIKILH